MQLKSIDGTITGLSGRMGEFMFRTYKNGKIFVHYKPRKKSNTTVMDREWTENESIMASLRQVTSALNLQIIES